MTDKLKRGFALMKPEKQREIASKGGKKAHEMGVAHRWDKDSASAAGRCSQASGRAHRFTTEEAKQAGKRGGAVTAAKRKGEPDDE